MRLAETTNLTKNFADTVAVDDITMWVDSGEIVGLLGANGAGKTTLIRMLLGLLEPTSGQALTLGRPAGEADRRAIGYLPQGLGLYPELTVTQNLEFVAAAFGVPNPELPPPLLPYADSQVGEISLGLRRRTAFIAALCHDPSLLILDEPTSGVGPLGRAELWETIHNAAEQGAGILVSTHYMEEAEECDRVIVMARAREVASGEVSDIIGERRSVAITAANEQAVEKLREAGLIVLAHGRDWRVANAAVEAVRSIVGPGVIVRSVPASFEEAFVELSL
jgi:ABC-2 type transport system ATP-binding protein/ribosome-dependent ATPase